MMPAETQLLDDVQAQRDTLIERVRELVSIPTVNPYSGDASAASEAPGQDWIEALLRRMGATVRRVPVPEDVYERGGMIGPADRSWEGRENVVAEWRLGSGEGPVILLNNHMDTVGTEGMAFDPFDPVIEDGRIRGRGTSDTKGNTMMGLTAVEQVIERSDELSGRIIFESVVDEECNGGGAGTLACCLAGVTGDVALVLDGARGRITNGCNGIGTAALRILGRAGHSSYTTSVSAIDKAIEVKQAIDAFAAAHRKEFPDCAINVGVFRAGTLPAIVPGEAEIQLNASYAPADAARAEQKFGLWNGRLFRERFAEAIHALGKDDPWLSEHPVEVSWIKDLYPYFCPADDAYVALVVAAARQVESPGIEAAPMAAWFDGAHLARRLRVATIGMGHGTPGLAHSSTESVVIDDLMQGAQVVALTLHRMLAQK